jgi:hypothetical protein
MRWLFEKAPRGAGPIRVPFNDFGLRHGLPMAWALLYHERE